MEHIAGHGFLERVPFPAPDGQAPQLAAYEAGLARLRDTARWTAFIEEDEFLVPLDAPDLPTLLAEYEDVGGLVVPWRVFGSSGRRAHEDELVVRRLTRRARDEHPLNAAVKTIVQGRRVAEAGVHVPRLAQGALADGTRIVAGAQGDPSRHAVPGARRLVVNHCFCKSWEEWTAKRDRGRATRRRDQASRIRSDADFCAHDVNEVEDVRALRFEEAVRAEMERLGRPAGALP